MSETVLITGCSSGIGRATASAFLADGWDVYATAGDAGESSDLERAGATTARLDVTSDADVDRVVDRVLEESVGSTASSTTFGNRFAISAAHQKSPISEDAGFGQAGPVEDVPIETVREQYDANAFGPHRLMCAALPHMRKRGAGTIVNVTSITDRFPIAAWAPTAARSRRSRPAFESPPRVRRNGSSSGGSLASTGGSTRLQRTVGVPCDGNGTR